MNNIVEFRSVTKHYEQFGLDMSFGVPVGSIVGLVGRNGAGKTTAIKLLAGAIFKESGTLRLFGQDIEKLPTKEKEHLAVCYDDLYIYGEYSALDVESFMKYLYKTWDSQKYAEYIKRFELKNYQKIKTYSRGMKMKLSLAIALSHDTKLLVLDESTTGLDPIVRGEILDILRDFVQDENRSVLISSHITSDLEKICDYIVFIDNGKVVLDKSITALQEEFAILKCTPEELQNLPEGAVVRAEKGRFGVEALVRRNLISQGMMDNAGIEDILRFVGAENHEISASR